MRLVNRGIGVTEGTTQTNVELVKGNVCEGWEGNV